MKHPVDTHVGKRVRHCRWAIGMSQQQLADKVGVKFQQVQKYEAGMNRVSASRLWDIADALQVNISYFFRGMNDAREANLAGAPDLMENKEAVDLLRAYYGVPEAQRSALFDLARALSQPPSVN